MYVSNKKGCVVTQKLKSLVWTISRLMAEWTILEGSDFIFAYIMALLKEKKISPTKTFTVSCPTKNSWVYLKYSFSTFYKPQLLDKPFLRTWPSDSF